MKPLAIGPHALMPSKLPRCRGVYLIHFATPYTSANGKKTIQHYLGFAERSIRARIERHRAGQGARLMQVVTAAGIEWEVVHLWLEATRTDERRLKRQRKAWRLCPRCNGALRRGSLTQPAPTQYLLPF